MEIVTADIGGTHARFAIATVERGRVVALSEPVKMATSDHASLQIAWQAFGVGLGRALPRAAAIAIAAPVRGELIKLTNNPWLVRPALIPEQLGVDTHVLINDFEAIAHAVNAVDHADFVHVTGPDVPLPDTAPNITFCVFSIVPSPATTGRFDPNDPVTFSTAGNGVVGV